ncbi:MAG: GAF domain-containing protein [Planctomycetes bacterium]|nr:GAF domain-containing protein [Planctomycetota bacterium]
MDERPRGKGDAPGRAASPSRPLERELVERAGWFIKLRWLAAALVLAGAWGGRLLGYDVPAWHLSLMAAVIASYNAFLLGDWRAIAASPRIPLRFFALFADAQVVFDYLALAVVIHFTGGITSPLIVFYVFHIIASAFLIPQYHRYYNATLAVILVGLVTFAEALGWISHFAVLFDSEDLALNPRFIAGHYFFIAASFYVTRFLAGTIGSSLARKLTELVSLKDELESRNYELGLLYELEREASRASDLQGLMDLITCGIPEVLGVRACAIKLLDEGGERLRFASVCGLDPRRFSNESIEVAKSEINREVLAGVPVVVAETSDADLYQFPEALRSQGIRATVAVPLRGRGEIFGVLAAYSVDRGEFTEREIRLLRLAAELVAGRIELASINERLANLDREKSEFMNLVAHELRSPMAAIHSILETITKGFVGPVAPKHLELLRRASRRAAQLVDLVNDLLRLARSQRGLDPRDRIDLSLEEVVRNGIELFSAEANDKGIAIEDEIESGPWTIHADRAGMRYIVSNLVSNAIKYTPNGGTVRVRLAHGRDGAAELFVEDTGIGIPAAELPRLFTEFFRASNARDVEVAGTGLGLAICQRIIRDHGGAIQVATEEGKGTCFRVRLPRAKPSPT